MKESATYSSLSRTEMEATIPTDDMSSSLLLLSELSHDNIMTFDPVRHQTKYTVGVFATSGVQEAMDMYEATFRSYLTDTAGQLFYPPISFDIMIVNDTTIFDQLATTTTMTNNPVIDFIYVDPVIYTCLEMEYKAQSLVSQISRYVIDNTTYELDQFGGIIFTRADDDRIHTIYDIKDKIVAAASFSGLGSGQAEFVEMIKAGMSYLNDPKQLIFTQDPNKIIAGVLSGQFDVGFVRTGQLETTKDVITGPFINMSMFKIIHQKENVVFANGRRSFPIPTSTDLYPEWNVGVLSHVGDDVGRIVQQSLLAMKFYAEIDMTTIMNHTNGTNEEYIRNISQIAQIAMERGQYGGWRTSLSYMGIVATLHATGYANVNMTTASWTCARESNDIYQNIQCPMGYHLVNEYDFYHSCDVFGLSCPNDDSYTCFCRPCRLDNICSELQIGGRCVSYVVLLPFIMMIPLLLLIIGLIHWYLHKQTDTVWLIHMEELHFDAPTVVIGRGSFGVVLLAEYRGTSVAVKRMTSLCPDHITNLQHPSLPYQTNHNSTSYDDVSSQFDQNVTTSNRNHHSSNNNQLNGTYLGTMTMNTHHHHHNKSILRCFQSHRYQMQMEFVREMKLLAKLRHPCITTVMGAVLPIYSEPMLVMEYMEYGSLYDVLRNDNFHLEFHHSMSFLKDIIQGIRFLHAAVPRVIHGDLKTKNVLVDANFRAKIADFGLAANQSIGIAGSPYWMAPELLLGKSKRTTMSDMYAYGVVMWEVFSLKDPYDGEIYENVIKQICDSKIDKRLMVPTSCPVKIANLMKDCWIRQPHSRPTAEQIDIALKIETTVEERTCTLEALNRELEEANHKIASSSIKQLEHFASMSHEIRTPLSCIMGISSILQGTELSTSQEECVAMIVSSSNLLQMIVDDVLDYSKLESGNIVIERKPTDLQKVVAESMRSMGLSAIAKKKQLQIRTKLASTLYGTIETDGRRLQQILYNLLSNACKFCKDDDGTVELEVSIIHPIIVPMKSGIDDTNDNSVNQTFIRFSVLDNGKGIDSKDFTSIFEPFMQAKSGINNTEGGTGLGLAITKKLVEALGGNIGVDSQLGSWTKFHVEFPYDGPSPDVEILRQPFDKSYFIMLVTDDPNSQHTYAFVNVMKEFHFPYQILTDMNELDKTTIGIHDDNPQQSNDHANDYICFIPTHFHRHGIIPNLTSSKKVMIVTYGNKGSRIRDEGSSSPYHFDNLAYQFPANILKQLGDCLQEYNLSSESPVTTTISHINRGIPETSTISLVDHFHSLRILVVDDNKVNQKVLSRILTTLGVTNIEVASNGLEAVEMEAEIAFDVVFMDIQMPIMDGLEAWRNISTRSSSFDHHPIPKVIFCTAHVSASTRGACSDFTSMVYLPKPISKDSVKESLLQAM